MFSPDFKELLSVFSEHRVKYLIVGGYAVAIHAQPRATKDLDLFVQSSPENAKAVASNDRNPPANLWRGFRSGMGAAH